MLKPLADRIVVEVVEKVEKTAKRHLSARYCI